MFIQNNSSILNICRNWGIHNQNAQKSLLRLSSGLRINSAADDAAGLGISEKMKSQLRMLSVERRMTEDQLSVYQTQDAKLGQVQGMMDRMVELATKSMSGSYQDRDRLSMNSEYQQLLEEIDRILPTASFKAQSLFGKTDSGAQLDTVFQTNDIAGYMDGLNAFLDEVNAAAKNKDIEGALSLGIDLKDSLSDSERLRKAVSIYTEQYAKENEGKGDGGGAFSISVTGDNISIEMSGSDVSQLGLKGTDLLSMGSAGEALEALRNAKDMISSQRAGLGAMMNRMEYTKNRLARMEVDLTASVSRITDADMAKEMMQYMKSQMLGQVNAFLMTQMKHDGADVLKLIAN